MNRNLRNLSLMEQASMVEKTFVKVVSRADTEHVLRGNLGMKPLRECKVCGKTATNALELEKFKSASECKFGRANLCNECYDEKYMKRNNERRISFKGKQVYIAVNVRVNVCEICGAKREENQGKQMAMHHDLYIKGKPLDFTVEECLVCHGKERGKK